MNEPHPDDSLLALGWMQETERLACERALASEPARAVSLRRNEDMIAQLGALGPLHPAPASVRTGAMAVLAADPGSGFVPATARDDAEPPAAGLSGQSATRPRPGGLSPGRWLRHPLAGWAVAAAIALLATLPRDAQSPGSPDERRAESDSTVWGTIRRAVTRRGTEGRDVRGSGTPEAKDSSVAGEAGPRASHPSPRPPDPLEPRAPRVAAALPTTIASTPGAEDSTAVPPSSLNRMVVIVLRPPDSPIPPDLLATGAFMDRVAAAVANDPSWLPPGAGSEGESLVVPEEPPPPSEETAPDPALSSGEAPVAGDTATVPATPSAWAIFNETSGEGSLIVDALPPLGPEEAYQIWLVDAAREAPVSVGLLPPLPEGSGHVNFTFSRPGLTPQDFLITKERATGAATPSGSVVLRRP